MRVERSAVHEKERSIYVSPNPNLPYLYALNTSFPHMALPDKLADLFGQNNPSKLPAVKGLQQLSYKISWDPLDDETTPPELKSQLAGLYEAVRNRPNRRQVEQLQNLVQQYPNVPILKNYLMLAYELTGQKSRARELLDQTVNRTAEAAASALPDGTSQ